MVHGIITTKLMVGVIYELQKYNYTDISPILLRPRTVEMLPWGTSMINQGGTRMLSHAESNGGKRTYQVSYTH